MEWMFTLFLLIILLLLCGLLTAFYKWFCFNKYSSGTVCSYQCRNRGHCFCARQIHKHTQRGHNIINLARGFSSDDEMTENVNNDNSDTPSLEFKSNAKSSGSGNGNINGIFWCDLTFQIDILVLFWLFSISNALFRNKLRESEAILYHELSLLDSNHSINAWSIEFPFLIVATLIKLPSIHYCYNNISITSI